MLNNKKVLAIGGLALAVIIGGTAVGVARYNQVSLTKDTAEIEFGEEPTMNPTEFLKGNERKINAATMDFKEVDFSRVGLYPVTISCGNKEFEIKLSIRDTKAPELTLKDRIVCGINTPITANECLAEVVDADNNLKATFQDAVLTDENIAFEKYSYVSTKAIDTSAIYYTEVGEYDNVIYVEDTSGNKTEQKIHISILNAPTINAENIEAEVNTEIDYLANATAEDSEGNDITENLRVKDVTTNVTVPGEYEATYEVEDGNGVVANKKITVTVKEGEKSEGGTSTGSGNNTTSGTNTSSGNNTTSGTNKGTGTSGNTSSSNGSNGTVNNDNGGTNSNQAVETPSSDDPYADGQTHAPIQTETQPYWVKGPSATDGTLNEEQKAYIDGLVESWLNGGYTDAELDWAITQYLVSEGLGDQLGFGGIHSNNSFTLSEGGTFEEMRLANVSSTVIYSYFAIYVSGEISPFSGQPMGYAWEVTIG